MGVMKQRAIELMEEKAEQEKREWIEGRYGEIDERSPEWYEAEENYYNYSFTQGGYEDDDEYENGEDSYYVKTKSRYEIFIETIENAKILNATEISPKKAEDNLRIMLYGHVVAAIEGYLSFTFIDRVLRDDSLIKKLLETDPIFAERTVTLRDMFKRQDGLKTEIEAYLKELIFHKLSKIKPMYKSVLNVDFGDVVFLYKAVERRHDCVHRAGFDKDGAVIEITNKEIDDLISGCEKLVTLINTALISRLAIDKKGD